MPHGNTNGFVGMAWLGCTYLLSDWEITIKSLHNAVFMGEPGGRGLSSEKLHNACRITHELLYYQNVHIILYRRFMA